MAHAGLVLDPDAAHDPQVAHRGRGPGATLPQQIARVDTIDRRPIAGAVEAAVIAMLERELPRADALLISDYLSGTVTPEGGGGGAAHGGAARACLITVDAQGEFAKFHGVTIFRCNDREAEAALGVRLCSRGRFRRRPARAARDSQTEGVVVTRGPGGMSVLDRRRRLPPYPCDQYAEVFDVTGAGDTVIAVLTLALTAGAPLLDAARLANYAAGIVVQKVGNVTLRPEELRARLLSAE